MEGKMRRDELDALLDDDDDELKDELDRIEAEMMGDNFQNINIGKSQNQNVGKNQNSQSQGKRVAYAL